MKPRLAWLPDPNRETFVEIPANDVACVITEDRD
jgi:hypothetical protein